MAINKTGDSMKEIININDLFSIEKGSIISIVGSGGKTTLLFFLAAELKHNYNVLVTTSAKILKPLINQYDFLFTNVESFINSDLKNKNNITVISKSINESNNKLIGIDDNDLEKLIGYFDVILIEADGSNKLPLKGWKNHEPPVLKKSNKTIGIIPVSVLGRDIDTSYIYGYEEFKKLAGNESNVNEETIKNICISENGIFKNSAGEKYLFINQADTKYDVDKSVKLAKYLHENIENINFKIVIGSLQEEKFYEY